MANFAEAINYVLENEGGYSNDPNDPGGATNFGIEQRDWPQVNIATITRDQAISWYLPNYWNKAPYDNINSQQIATKLFDTHVNCGMKSAFMMAQKALGFSEPNIDGNLGPMTLAAINQANTQHFLDELVTVLTLHYKLLEQQNPKLVVFDRGWMARATKLPPADAS